jgi:YD repeat-containing protein
MTSRTLPGETSAPTTSWAYTDWCAATGEQAPCLEVDSTQRLDSSDTITSRAFYDGYGNLIETRDPGPNGQDVVRYRVFDVSGRDVKDSIPYFVASYSGGPGAAAFATPDSNQHGTLTAYDGLGRALTVTDPLGGVTTTSYITECGWDAPSDPACYAVTFTYDPLQHQTLALSDGLGRLDRNAVSTGNSPSTWAWYTEVDSTYDANGQLVKWCIRTSRQRRPTPMTPLAARLG